MNDDVAGRADAAGARRVAFIVAALGLALQLAVNLTGGYGLFRDELYYLACADHLGWGYVDQPALSVLLLAGVRAVFGDSLFAVRLLPALAGFVLILLTGWIARELGGGRRATLLATLAALIAPVYLSICGFYSMNAFDLAFWAACFLILLRIVKTGDHRLWLVFGVVAGLAFENKIGILFLGAGLFVALLATPLRRELASRWFWIGMAIAGLLALPYVLWQVAHQLATLEFMRNAAAQKNAPTTPLAFLWGQIDMLHPVNALIWVPGLVFLAVTKEARRFRFLAIAYVVIFFVFALQNGKPYYLAGFYPVLFAAGGVAIERLAATRPWRWLTPTLAALLVLGGAVAVPLVLPMLPPETFVRYARALGQSPGSEERDQPPKLGQHYADMFGWRELAETVARVYRTLSPEEQGRVMIFCRNYGEAGAIDYFGRALGLPRAVSGHNSYWIWGPGQRTAAVVIAVGGDESEYQSLFERCEVAAVSDHPYARSFERNRPVYVCRGPKLPVEELWLRLKFFI
jgi:uncharacterized membrane protein